MAGRTRIVVDGALRADLNRIRTDVGDQPLVFDDLEVFVRAPQPITVLRAADLLHARFSFVNLAFDNVDGVRVLRRRLQNRAAYLLVDLQPQHVIERAFYADSGDGPTSNPQSPANGSGSPPPPDSDTGNPSESVALPVRALLSTHTRLAFKITSEAVPYTLQGLLTAIGTLPLSVAPHAVTPRRRFVRDLAEVLVGPSAKVATRIGDAAGRNVAGRVSALARSVAAAKLVQHRLGTTDALVTVAGMNVATELGLTGDLDKIIVPGLITPKPIPREPLATETAIELPWRLKLSPGPDGGFAHAPTPVTHDDRTELWHTRLGVRATSGDDVRVDEDDVAGRTARAIWARDFTQFPFTAEPVLEDIPAATGADDDPEFRKSLNSRDRILLVHETSNFGLTADHHAYAPPPVQVERLMLTSLGGWLRSDLTVSDLPDGPYSLQRWKHRATMGRDHEVTVVYAGFLFPFGHRASVVKITERKFTPDLPGDPAVLYQRFFIVVREQTKQYADPAFYNDQRGYVPVKGKKKLDLVMPLATVSILTTVTPDLDDPNPPFVAGPGGLIFFPHVDNAPFGFKILAVDRLGHTIEYSGPLLFVERDHNDQGAQPGRLPAITEAYWNAPDGLRRHQLGGQQVTYADITPLDPNDPPLQTTLATQALYWDAAVAPHLVGDQDVPMYAPMLREADVVQPAMSALAGANAPIKVSYPKHYAEFGMAQNAGQVFLAVASAPKLDFSAQGDRSGGFVTPNLAVTGLSGRTGPIGGDLTKAVSGTTDPADFFSGIKAKLFGLVPLAELLKAVGLTPDRFPAFVGEALDRVTAFLADLERIKTLAADLPARFGAAVPGPQLTALATQAVAVLNAVASFDPSQQPALQAQLDGMKGGLDNLKTAIETATALPAGVRTDAAGVLGRVREHVDDAADLAGVIAQFAQGVSLPPVITARLGWSTELAPWPTGAAVFQPVPKPGQSPADARAVLDLSVEVQAPTVPGKQPTAIVSCSFTPFRLQLVGDDWFVALAIEKIEFLLAPGRKPDVNVVFAGTDGVEFGGPLTFVNTLREIIPFDGFSDPPYLDVSADGIKAGFDLPVPTLAVGVFSLANISLGAHLRVPFIDDSLDFTFSFCTRENPFRLTVWLFGGGGFFAITVTPEKVRVLEAAFEFGAAVAIDFGVASGSIECMAGIYFRLEDEASKLVGYFRLRGEVDVLGLISACIELYLELSYEPPSGKAVGTATLSIEVEVCFLSFSVSITAEKKFKGSNQDPTFAQIMGVPPGGGPRPWDEYCAAFAAA